jgi:23S rRNA pseudouridine1911/1915/1917 synthase
MKEEIKIIYEDNHIVVINKPAGLIVHSDGKREEESVASWMLKHYPQTESVGESIELSSGEKILRPGIVHRIDKETSGVLILAKTEEGFLFLKKEFKERNVKKIYHAFVWGSLNSPDGSNHGTINRPIGRSRNDFRKRSAQRGARGQLREAVTDYQILKKNKEFSFLEVLPRTGRTHQIRVHMMAINHPIVGDSLYAPKRPRALGFERLALHAKSLSLKIPSGEEKVFEASYPPDFEKGTVLFEKSEDLPR